MRHIGRICGPRVSRRSVDRGAARSSAQDKPPAAKTTGQAGRRRRPSRRRRGAQDRSHPGDQGRRDRRQGPDHRVHLHRQEHGRIGPHHLRRAARVAAARSRPSTRSSSPAPRARSSRRVDTKNFSGPISKSILLVSNDPDRPQLNLFVKATVKPYVDILPTGVRALLGRQGRHRRRRTSSSFPRRRPSSRRSPRRRSRTSRRRSLPPARRTRSPDVRASSTNCTSPSRATRPRGC